MNKWFIVQFPKNPYIGQIYYNPDTKRTFEFCETTCTDKETGMVTESAMWIDITDKDLNP
tara:strand:- start:160 stop:339 length:180 start_codon:yes stop_codon:yes gene_type:complete